MNTLKKIPQFTCKYRNCFSSCIYESLYICIKNQISFYYYFQEAVLREMVSGNGLTETTAHFSSL